MSQVDSTLPVVHIELTVTGPAGSRDVAITAPADTDAAAVSRALTALIGVDEHAAMWCDGAPVEPTRRLDRSPLRTGARVRFGDPAEEASGTGPVLRVVGGGRAGTVFRLRAGTVTLGRAAGNTVVVDDDDASRHHAVLDVTRRGIVVRDLGSTNGTWLDASAVEGEQQVHEGQLLRIADSLFTIGEVVVAPAVAADAAVVHRRVRALPDAAAAVIDTAETGDVPTPGRVQWLAAMLPAVLGVTVAVALDSPQFLLFMLLSPVMILGGAAGDRVHWRRSRRRLASRRRSVHLVTRATIEAGLKAETRRRRHAAPDATVLAGIAAGPGDRLWERRATDADHLCVRIGTAHRPAQLQVRQGALARPAGTVPDVPVSVDLRLGPLEVGGPVELRTGVARWVLSQLAVLQSPSDLELVLLLGADDLLDTDVPDDDASDDDASDDGWRWLRWLPHLRRVAVGRAECIVATAELRDEVERRRTVTPTLARTGWHGRWTLVVAARGAASTPGLAALVAGATDVGFSAVFVTDGDDPSTAPSSVRGLSNSGRIRVASAAFTGPAVVDRVSPAWTHTVARSLSPLRDAGAVDEASLSRTGLLDLLGLDAEPDAIGRRWASADGGAAAAVGIGADGPVTIDLVRDGPHALVAGTTGSGKSELLRSLVSALAMQHPPDELAFVLVDYKGGSAFRECATFPHTAAVVTDLDAALTRRALRSLHAELARRETVLADAGVADLAGHRRRRGQGEIPRLVIVVDEFAELAGDLPDFVAGLLAVARRGRALGVHLVLATQRPGGVVSPEIRANTGLRIALRVTDATESTDVIGIPDAALLPGDRPGGAVVRTAGGATMFRTALAGRAGRTEGELDVRLLDGWRRPVDERDERDDETGADGLVALAEAMSTAARRTGRPAARSPWCPPLPDRLSLQPRSDGAPRTLRVGLVDLPDRQCQPDLVVDLDHDRSIVVAGRSGSGRTTALATVLSAATAPLSPGELEVYIVDAAGDLATVARRLPHVATCLGPSDLRLVPRLLDRLCERDETTRSAVSTLVLLDGWDRIVTPGDDSASAGCVAALDRLARLGAAARVTIVAAGDRGLLTPRAGTAGFAARYALELSDRADYALLGVPPREVPPVLPPGRAVRGSDGATVQFAYPDPMADRAAYWADYDSDSAPATGAVRLRSLPRRVRSRDVAPPDDALRLGLAGDAAQPCLLRADHHARLLVAGPPRSGRSTVLRTVLAEALRLGLVTIVACNPRSPLHDDARRSGALLITPDAPPSGTLPRGAVLLIDDVEDFTATSVEPFLLDQVRPGGSGTAVVTGRCDELAGTFRGPAAEIRRARCGILLRPGRLDGELLGISTGLPLSVPGDRPGAGVIVGDPRWGSVFADGPVPIQVAEP